MRRDGGSEDELFPFAKATGETELVKEGSVEELFALAVRLEILRAMDDERGVQAFDAGGIEGVMEFDGGDNGFRDSPKCEEISANMRVGGSENSHFGLFERNVCFGGKFDGEAILRLGVGGEN